MTSGVVGMYDFRSASITVSGYPPVAAMTVVMSGVTVGTVASMNPALLWQPLAQHSAPSFRQVWCAPCKKLVPASMASDDRLGFTGYCTACVRQYAEECLGRNRRLPAPGEFYCVPCRKILDIALMCPQERDGRQRRKCKGCRLGQLRQLRRLRREAGGKG